jgi:hypothetical protein
MNEHESLCAVRPASLGLVGRGLEVSEVLGCPGSASRARWSRHRPLTVSILGVASRDGLGVASP